MIIGTLTGSKGFANPSGWMNNELFPQVLKHFISHFNGETEKPKLLLLDHHARHASLETIELATNNNIAICYQKFLL